MISPSGNKIIRMTSEAGEIGYLSVDELIARGLNKWNGYVCGAGFKYMYFDYDGNVWRCNAGSERRNGMIRQEIPVTDEMKNRHKGYLGNINESFEIPNDVFVCPWKSCNCGADILVPKAHPAHQNKLMINPLPTVPTTMTSPVVPASAASETFFPIGRQILWDIGRRCNYACSYCWPEAHSRTDPHLPWETITRVSQRMIDEWANGGMIRWYFGGGEPTLHPMFVDWMKWLTERNQWTLVTTNGSRPAKYWKELIPYLSAVNMSVHFEYANENKLMDNISTICEHFMQHNSDHWLEIKLMSTPLSLDRAIALKDRIINSGMLSAIGANGQPNGTMSLVPIRDLRLAGKIVEYTPEQMKLLENQ